MHEPVGFSVKEGSLIGYFIYLHLYDYTCSLNIQLILYKHEICHANICRSKTSCLLRRDHTHTQFQSNTLLCMETRSKQRPAVATRQHGPVMTDPSRQ